MKGFCRTLIFLAIGITVFSSCRLLRPAVMMKTPRGYQFATLNDSMSKQAYQIEVANMLRVSISPNDGFNKVNFTLDNNQQNSKDYLEMLVGIDGKIKLPLVGLVSVIGKTTRELEEEIEKLYQNYYVRPFVTVQVMNRRVVVFMGNGGAGRALPLLDYNTTLFEVLGQAGGIQEDGKAYRIKLIRTYGGKTQVFKIDLSKIKYVSSGNLVIMPNDVIYVEPRMRYTQRTLAEIVPYLSLLSTSILFYGILKKP